MIIRIMGEGQLEVGDEDLAALNDLDGDLEAAIETGDESKFRTALHALLDNVREVGKPLPSDSLVSSGLILPPADSDMAEVKAMLGDEGLIPD
jgi:hypothetical protein